MLLIGKAYLDHLVLDLRRVLLLLHPLLVEGLLKEFPHRLLLYIVALVRTISRRRIRALLTVDQVVRLKLAFLVAVDHGSLCLRAELLLTLRLHGRLEDTVRTALALITCKAVDATIAILDHRDTVRLPSSLRNLNHLD